MQSLTMKVRPQSIDEIVGMEYNKQIIKYDVLGARALNEPVPSYIFAGPPGTGKTTLGDVIAIHSKRPNGESSEVFKMLGSNIKSPEDLIDIAVQCKDGDIIFLEEAHSIGGGSKNSAYCQALLLEWIENFRILGSAGTMNFGPNGDAPKVCFLFPTTNPGKLSFALRTRCKILHTSYYNLSDMEEIIRRSANKFGMNVDSDPAALRLLAQSSRGTPRVAIMHRLDSLRKVMTVDQLPYCLTTVRKCLQINNINDWGLEANDIKYCHILYNKIIENSGRPIAKKTMEHSLGFSSDLIDIIEAYLHQIDAITIDTRGRKLNQFGCNIIGKNFITGEVKNNIDEGRLKEILKDSDVRRTGMKGIMGDFGLTYGKDNSRMKAALYACGFIVKRRIGIVPISENS